MPLFGLVRVWTLGLLAVGLWVGVGLLARQWSRELPDPRPPLPDPPPAALPVEPADQPTPTPPPAPFAERLAAWRPGADRVTALLAGTVALALVGVGGGRASAWLFLPKRADDPRHERVGEFRRVVRPDGADLHVEVSGRADGPTVVLTHGWGATATEWYHLRRQLADRYRVVAWDLRGLGRSKGPTDGNFGVDRMADDLRAVLDVVGGGPALLVGHSIGGMILLTLAKLHPEDLGGRVAGLVLPHTTPTNPLRTMPMAGLMTALQKPILEPLARVMIVLAPVVWAMNVLSYLNGSAHWSTYKSTFSWTGTWGQVEFVTRYALWMWPAAYARGVLGMFRYHAADALGRVTVPTLVVAADRDTVTVPAASEAIRAGVPGAALVTLTPAGHMGVIQRPAEFGRAVLTFAARVFPSRGDG